VTKVFSTTEQQAILETTIADLTSTVESYIGQRNSMRIVASIQQAPAHSSPTGAHLSARKIGENGWTRTDGSESFLALDVDSQRLGLLTKNELILALLHTAVHYASPEGDDLSNGGRYHNTLFRANAVLVPLLTVSKDEKTGYSVALSEQGIAFSEAYDLDMESFNIVRMENTPKSKPAKRLGFLVCSVCNRYVQLPKIQEAEDILDGSMSSLACLSEGCESMPMDVVVTSSDDKA